MKRDWIEFRIKLKRTGEMGRPKELKRKVK